MAYQYQKVKARQVVAQTTQTQGLGIVSTVPMGDWNTVTQYQKLNTVRYNGATYQAKKSSQGVEPTVTPGWQEVWQIVVYDGGTVEPNGTYPGMTVGNASNATNAENASNATNDGNGNNIAEQFETIESYIPLSTSADNQLTNKEFVNSSINNMAAFYITYNASGGAFPTRASLLSATTFYYGGQVRTPTQNDYAIVLADESQPQGADGKYPTTRYSYQGSAWSFQYVVNNTSLTQSQVDAINSGITAELVSQIGASEVKADGTYPNMTVGIADKATNDSDGNNIATTYFQKSGGTINGDLIVKGKQYVHVTNGGSSSEGYIRIADITINESWSDNTIVMELSARSYSQTKTIYICFDTASGTDPDLKSFRYTGAGPAVYMRKMSSGVWSLIVRKVANDYISVLDYRQTNNHPVAVDWIGVHSSTLLANSVECIPIGDFSIKNDTAVDTYYRAARTDITDSWIAFGIGSGGTNRGIYDKRKGMWVFSLDASNNILIGGVRYAATMSAGTFVTVVPTENPAATVGGDWERLGTTETNDGETLYVWGKIDE